MADDRDSKSCGEIRVGSSPTTGIRIFSPELHGSGLFYLSKVLTSLQKRQPFSAVRKFVLDSLKKNKNITLLTMKKLCDIIGCTLNDIVRFKNRLSRKLRSSATAVVLQRKIRAATAAVLTNLAFPYFAVPSGVPLRKSYVCSHQKCLKVRSSGIRTICQTPSGIFHTPDKKPSYFGDLTARSPFQIPASTLSIFACHITPGAGFSAHTPQSHGQSANRWS